MNYIFIGWGFEGVEEVCRKEWYDWLKVIRGRVVVFFIREKCVLKCLKRECRDDLRFRFGRGYW